MNPLAPPAFFNFEKSNPAPPPDFPPRPFRPPAGNLNPPAPPDDLRPLRRAPKSGWLPDPAAPLPVVMSVPLVSDYAGTRGRTLEGTQQGSEVWLASVLCGNETNDESGDSEETHGERF